MKSVLLDNLHKVINEKQKLNNKCNLKKLTDFPEISLSLFSDMVIEFV